jgi:hypothetical protein
MGMAGKNGSDKDQAKRDEIDSRKAILKTGKTGKIAKGGDDPKSAKGGKG